MRSQNADTIHAAFVEADGSCLLLSLQLQQATIAIANSEMPHGCYGPVLLHLSSILLQ